MGQLDEKVALVTGAAAGLGNAFARALAGEGAALALCDTDESLFEIAEEIRVPVFAEKADVSKPADIIRFVEATLQRFGRIDVLVNNAGTWTPSLPADPIDKSLRDYEKIVGTNLRAAFLFGRAVIPGMIERGSGEIVNISTNHLQTCGNSYELNPGDSSSRPRTDAPPCTSKSGPATDIYDASKWGITGLTLAWSQAVAEHGIRVNSLCMGATDTALMRSFFNPPPSAEVVARWTSAEDIARILIELLREGPDGRTGEDIVIATGHPVVLPPSKPSPYVVLGESVY